MKFVFLGGADEIGASATLIEIAGRRILVDCGLRHYKRDGEIIPWLAAVEDAGKVDAIILTHAHLDHSGALPIAHRSFGAPLFMTAPTRDIVSILLSDTLKIMEQENEREGDLPQYSAPTVEATIAATRKVQFLDATRICEGVIATFYPAGHILGAASVVLESNEGSIMISGDIYAKDQLTVAGLMLPRIRPDAMILECTYGNRLHVNRSMEEKRLIEQVEVVIKRGGITLIPAFAIGRSQEILLILLKAIEEGRLPRVPIVIDGMVRQICALYPSYKDWCGRWLRKRIKDLGNPFTYKGSPAFVIRNPRERAEVIKKAPAIIVASSGMLSGGPSQLYAGLLAEDPKNHIAFCGYNDEESPGRKLLSVAEAGQGEIKLGERVITPKCSVGMYRLSAHSDSSDLAAEARALNARNLFLVHSEDGAREELATVLKAELKGKIILPDLGTESFIVKNSSHFASIQVPTETIEPSKLEEETPIALLRKEDLTKLAGMLLDRDGPKQAYTVQEIMNVWGYKSQQFTEQELSRVNKLISSDKTLFVRDKRRAFLYLVNQAADLPETPIEDATNNPMPIAIMLNQIDQVLPPETGMYRKSYNTSDYTVKLLFDFPKIAQMRYAEKLLWLEDITKWKIAVHLEPRYEKMQELIRKLIPKEWQMVREPSIHRMEERIVVTVEIIDDPNLAETIASDFLAQTGFRLEIKSQTSQGSFTVMPIPNTTISNLPNSPQIEINQAFSHIKKTFEQREVQVIKVSLKNGHQGKFIEVAFITPQVGERYLDLLAQLQTETGWKIHIRPNADEFRVKQLAKDLTKSFEVVREPSLTPGTGVVQVKILYLPTQKEEEDISNQFWELTGYTLVFEQHDIN